jgi:hypothetical protein
MEISDFTRALSRLSGDDLRTVAASIEASHQSAGDEVDAWRAVLHIDHVLRKTGKARQAALAAHNATRAVLAVAQGVEAVPDHEATRVARAAAMVARGMVAGEDAAGDVRRLLGDWSVVVPNPAVSDAA